MYKIYITVWIHTRFPSFFPATAHTLKYERSEELGKNLALVVDTHQRVDKDY